MVEEVDEEDGNEEDTWILLHPFLIYGDHDDLELETGPVGLVGADYSFCFSSVDFGTIFSPEINPKN